MHRIDAMFDRLQCNIGRQSRKAVGMKLQRKISKSLFHSRNEGRNPFGRQQTARIFDEHAIDADRHQLLSLADIIGVSMDRTVGIDQPRHYMNTVASS